MTWTAWVTWDRIARQENRLHQVGAEVSTPIFECALAEPAKYATKAHLGEPGEVAPCDQQIPLDDPDRIALWAKPADGVAKCKLCQRRAP